MTAAESLISSINLLKPTTPNYVDTKSFCPDANQFSSVLESANKSYNFTYEKVSETPLPSIRQNKTLPVNKSFLNSKANVSTNEKTTAKNEVKESKEQNKITKNNSQEKTSTSTSTSTNQKTDKNEKKEEVSEKKTTDNSKAVDENISKNSVKEIQNNNINLILAVTVPIQTVQPEKKPSVFEKTESNLTKKQDSTDNSKISNIPNSIESKVINTTNHDKSKQVESKQSIAPENNSAKAKDIDKNTSNTIDTKQKTENTVSNQQQETKSSSFDVQVNIEALRNTKIDTQKPEGTNKLKPEIIDDLKPRVTKIQLEQTENSNKKDLESNSDQKNNNVLSFNNIESQLIKLNLNQSTTTTSFEQVINEKTQQQPAINANNVLDQVTKNTIDQLQQNKSQISMVLNPDSLGKINIDFISEKGVLTAQLIAETKEAKDILSKDVDNLKQNLQDQGINVSNIVVKIQEPQQADNSQFNSDKNSNKNFEESSSFSNSNSSKDNDEQGKASYLTDSEINEMSASQKEASKEIVDNKAIDYTV
jgi:flagellar hook-length control protein FliK